MINYALSQHILQAIRSLIAVAVSPKPPDLVQLAIQILITDDEVVPHLSAHPTSQGMYQQQGDECASCRQGNAAQQSHDCSNHLDQILS